VGQLGLFALLAFVLLLGSSIDDPPIILRISGAVLFFAGAALGLLSLGHLGKQLTPYPKPVAGGDLVDAGLYALARHPIYGGVLLIALGGALFDANPLAIAVALVFPPYFWAKSGHEERMLLDHYPEYADYRQRVRRRMIPWLL
jgi:protein-S-isoprenylcysteine O-methyltransferase Ste14